MLSPPQVSPRLVRPDVTTRRSRETVGSSSSSRETIDARLNERQSKSDSKLVVVQPPAVMDESGIPSVDEMDVQEIIMAQ